MWWKNSVFYEIYLASFCDSNEDGIGDVRGVIGKIPYLNTLGITGIWLTPFYPSPKVDNGYDVSDYCDIASEYGTIEDLKELLDKVHQSGIKVIVDLVINHTSTEHNWFKDINKKDWYIWRELPNNWESFFGGSAWEFDERFKEYYYHSFSKEQADLNWANPEVKCAIWEVIDFWIDLGIDGFRLDVINNLSISNEFFDNPINEEGEQVHLYDVNQQGVTEVIKELKKHIFEKGRSLFTVGEISSSSLEIIESYSERMLLDVTFNFNFGSLEEFSVEKIFCELLAMKKVYDDGRRPTFFFNSHDMSRSWNRLASENLERYRQLAVLTLINAGVSFLFQGEELGIGDYLPNEVSDIRDIQAINKYNEAKDIVAANEVNRDRSRGMIPWERLKSDAWIGQGKKNEKSNEVFDFYKQLIQLRKDYLNGESTFDKISCSGEVLQYKVGKLIVLLNFGVERYYFPVAEEKIVLKYNYENFQLLSGGIMIGKEKNV
ncbi:alpha-amylase family glycosyl hydrolase [Lactococcus allomyrinae]|uniref:Glucohydrolase n=1 Tax=Lactococcus allomyrinae TaxID=2419773 RepID=A0A387BC70_9LACT|nr:alpha-amylase family glycosyl hydrolase [Lactococcus allomyrinae]AYF99943.1 glucohydrolase [Lactococcus allomyrinae]